MIDVAISDMGVDISRVVTGFVLEARRARRPEPVPMSRTGAVEGRGLRRWVMVAA